MNSMTHLKICLQIIDQWQLMHLIKLYLNASTNHLMINILFKSKNSFEYNWLPVQTIFVSCNYDSKKLTTV